MCTCSRERATERNVIGMTKLTVIVCAVIVTMCVVFPCMAEGIEGYYPRTAVVTDLDYDNDLVIITDLAGLDWVMEGIEDWQVGDLVSLLMYDNNTPDTIFDDEIVMAYYGGWIGLED